MVEERALAESQRKPVVRLDLQAIELMKTEIRLLQEMVRDLLTPGVDYGRIPGTPADSLWDTGASQIIGAFNCYAGQRRILKLEDTGDRIAVCVEVPVISRETGQVTATGIGAASTLEPEYKYRWVEYPGEWGYDAETAKGFKTRTERGKRLYRIPNPEHSELLNTIVKMASKRAEVDAAESLPGVASVLRQMFFGHSHQDDSNGPVWTRFWAEVRRLGLTSQEAHLQLGVTNMKQWLASGHSLDEALAIFRGSQQRRGEAEGILFGTGGLKTTTRTALAQAWDNARATMKQAGLPYGQYIDWFDQVYSLPVTQDELTAEDPPPGMTHQMISAFVDQINDFQTRLRQYRQAKGSTPRDID